MAAGLAISGCVQDRPGPAFPPGTPPDAMPRVRLTCGPGEDPACPDPASCTADYREFIRIAAPGFGRPISGEDLEEQIRSLDAGTVPLESKDLAPADLAARIIDGTGIRFLLDGLDERTLEVRTRLVGGDGFIRRDVVFVDPWVGSFDAVLLEPDAPGRWPAVIAVHGHGDTAETWMDSFHAGEFPRHGYAFLMLTMRAMAIDDAEHRISEELLRAGFSLVGLRVYEILLGFKYLRYLARTYDRIDAGRIGLIGHSGGSSASSLAIRIEPRFRACVLDHAVDWHRSDGPWEKLTGKLEPWHCETVPALFPLNARIRDLSTCATPVLQVPYGAAKGRSGLERILRFFDSRLGP